MKKKIVAIAALMLVAAIGLSGCAETKESNNSSNSGDLRIGVTDMSYYGCPNSKRVVKLNTIKKRRYKQCLEG